MAEVRFNLFALRKRLELQKEREVTWSEIARKAGLNKNTVQALASNQAGGIRLDTIEQLLNYFDSEGMEITPGDLFVKVAGHERVNAP